MSLDQLPETPVIEQRPYVPERRRVVPVYVRVIGIVLAATFGLSTLGLILLGAVSFLSVRADDSTTQSFSLTEAPASLIVHSDVVNLNIASGGTNTITVRTERHASAVTYDLAQRALHDMRAEATISANSVTVTTQLPNFGYSFGVNQIDMSVYVTVPATTHLDISTDVGNVNVQGVRGGMTITSNAGNLTLSDATFSSASSLRNDAGNISCDCALDDSASVRFSTVAGNIDLTLPQATSASLTATAGTGNVTIDQVWPLSVTRKDAGAVASGDLVSNPTGSITALSTVGNITVLAR